jgi:hypothetical protein
MKKFTSIMILLVACAFALTLFGTAMADEKCCPSNDKAKCGSTCVKQSSGCSSSCTAKTVAVPSKTTGTKTAVTTNASSTSKQCGGKACTPCKPGEKCDGKTCKPGDCKETTGTSTAPKGTI